MWRTQRTAAFPPDAAVGAPPPPAPTEGEEPLHHCPRCGSGSITGGSDGSITCGFCEFVFKVFAQPVHPSMPQTVNGQPYDIPGSARISDDPVPAAGAPAPIGGSPLPDTGATGGTGLEQFRVDGGGVAAPPSGGGLERFRTARFITHAGVAIPFDSFVAHLAIRHADDPPSVIEQVRASR